MTASVAVHYLARIAEGPAALEAFAASYRRHPAGLPHELVLLCKGAETSEAVAQVSAIFADIPHRAVPASDAGYDIQAYLAAARTAQADRLCFLNTFSEIRADGWLAKLAAALDRPGVGLVGATASYESLRDTRALIERLRWFVLMRGAELPEPDREGAYWLMRSDRAGRAARPTDWCDRLAAALLGHEPMTPALMAEFRTMRRALAPLNRRSELDDIPPFPNPHLRSNAMLIERDLLAGFGFDVPPTKADCFRFESGPASLTRRVQAAGLAVLLVGADGEAFPVESWPESRTFRLGGQENLLVSDNQTRRFDTQPPPMRAVYSRVTWGDAPGESPLFGVPLRRGSGTELAEARSAPAGPAPRPTAHGKREPTEPPLFSVVLPTCDAAAAAATVETVLRQDGADWELVLHDNASMDPGAARRLADRDPRIRLTRSETRLSMAESWDMALAGARGRYAIVLGDDDGLAPGALARHAATIRAFAEPELVVGRALSLTAPGTIEGEPEGNATSVAGDVLFRDVERGSSTAAPASAATSRQAVAATLGFRRAHDGRVAAMAIGAGLLARIRRHGSMRAGLLPELYLATLALAEARTVVADPAITAIAGTSATS